jgi:hypothetical protein
VAKQDRNQQDRNLEPDELVQKLGADAEQPPQVTLLSGYLGPSPADGYQRLYLDPSLTVYAEIAEDDIVNAEKNEAPGSPFGAFTTLWVKRGAQVRRTVVNTQRIQAEFLSGGIVSGSAGARGGPAAMARSPWPEQTWGFECDPRGGSMVSCSHWCNFTESGPRCTMAGPRCRSMDICPSDDIC